MPRFKPSWRKVQRLGSRCRKTCRRRFINPSLFHKSCLALTSHFFSFFSGYRAPAARAARANKPSGSAVAGASQKYDFSLGPEKEPPVGYICYRCGQKGHWIQNCPENDDPAAAERKRFVRVTGIPRSFLKTVETPVGAEGSSGGAMLTADGGFVKAVPDQRQWQKQAAVKPRALTGADVRDQEPLEADLTCPLCKKLVWEAVRTPCCNTAFCEECVQTYLVDHDFECPHCESKVPSLDRLKPDEDLRKRSRNYVDHELQKNKDAKGDSADGDVKEEAENDKNADDVRSFVLYTCSIFSDQCCHVVRGRFFNT